jgi:uncharacterized protein with GYD domain
MAGISRSKRIDILEAEIANAPIHVQDAYFCALIEGTDAILAHMLAMRQGPQMKGSDRAFGEGQRLKMGAMHERNRDKIQAIAEKAGIRTQGKYYVGGLGRYNDPAAWVSTADDVKSVLKAKNLTATGVVEHQGVAMPPPPPKRLSERLTREFVAKTLKAEPKTAEAVRKNPKKMRDLRERVIATHGARR